jgi:GT2 family glycosyltransferase
VSGDNFAILNPDIEFRDGSAVAGALGHLADPRVGVVVPALRLDDGSRQDSARTVPSLGDVAARRLVPRQRRRGEIAATRATDVPWAVAACWFVSRRWFDAIGGFDEGFFLYFEDVDYCVRLAKQGGVVRHDPDLVVEHRHRADSRSAMLGQANRHHIRSAGRFYRKHPEFRFGSRQRAAG